MKRPVAIIIRDGWGLNENPEANAVYNAKTPNIDAFKAKYPWTKIDCSGVAVGLPAGYQGSSEVGHLNMGAGRIVIQELKRIDDELSNGELFKSPVWAKLVENWKTNSSAFHMMGLLQDEGVHAHQEHLFKLMARARKEFPEGLIVIHPFLDGRDTPPRSCKEYIARLEMEIEKTGNCIIGTTMGRYYSMDRSSDWKLTDIAYNCMVCAEGREASSMEEVVDYSYANDQTPDGDEMVDEYIIPYVIGDFKGIQDGDSVLHTNYRQDRAIQISKAFLGDDYPGNRHAVRDIVYAGFTRYWDEFDSFLLSPMGGGGGMPNLLGDVVSKAGMKQLRIAETQKFKHVTSFFNGKSTTPSAGEDQVEVTGTFDPATFASHPEMDAYTVTEELLKRLEDNPYELIVVNYANCDMVGHTGNLAAATKAVEVVDECVGKIAKRLLELDASMLITADHGNAEQEKDYVTGMPKTSHTLNLVECIYVANDSVGKKMVDAGILSDIAPTALYLLGLDQPADMTSTNLIIE
jgi:2,3-bisphosphoglycerate-independent phosphoglycerate mutase